MNNMTGIRVPTREQLREQAADLHMDLREDEISYVESVIEEFGWSYERLDHLPGTSREPKFTRRNPGYHPDVDEDPYNAFVTKCAVRGADNGRLSGCTVGLKDNIAVAGVEETAGSSLLTGFIPEHDATITTRLLEAGATITGKLNMTPLAYYSQGGMTATGYMRNPHDSDRASGGSSGGSAIAVVTGDVDISFGTDQGGSIRNPAAYCGCVGLKPTFGLVPYTGIISIADPLDHVGPMARSVEDCARALEVVAGEDPADPRQRTTAVKARPYTDSLAEDVDDITIGILDEGFHGGVDDRVAETVLTAVDRLDEFGADVTEISVKWGLDGDAIWTSILIEGFAAKVQREGLHQYAAEGLYDTQFAGAFGKARRAQGDDFALPTKACLVMGKYLAEQYGGRYYAKAHNLGKELTAAYDDAFDEVDLLALPTTETVAPEIKPDTVPEEYISGYTGGVHPRVGNHFNVTGHPALSLPCGSVDDLPVGLQLVGETFRDDVLLRAAYTFEQNVDWQKG